MAMFRNPFDTTTRLGGGCACGAHASAAEHARACEGMEAETPATTEDQYARVIESAVLRAMFPQDAQRRAFLGAVGRSTAAAAIASLFPVGAAVEAFAQAGAKPGAIEKKALKIGFIPITCATPIIMADPLGFYKKHGLDVEVVKTAGWAVIRDKTINKEYDAAHMLAPMPIAITMGVGSN
ncbi:MAG TPA: ABC transporter substrate-binding protein, partial [Beijerinckiaceae bacterium]